MRRSTRLLIFGISLAIVSLFLVSNYYPIFFYAFKAKSIVNDETEYPLPKYYFVMNLEKDLHTLGSVKGSFSEQPKLFFVQEMIGISSALEKRGIKFYDFTVDDFEVKALFTKADDKNRTSWFVADTYLINTYDVQESKFPVELMHFYNRYYKVDIYGRSTGVKTLAAHLCSFATQMI